MISQGSEVKSLVSVAIGSHGDIIVGSIGGSLFRLKDEKLIPLQFIDQKGDPYVFNSPAALILDGSLLYVAERGRNIVSRVNLLAQWTKESHHLFPRLVQKSVVTLLMMRKRKGTLWAELPLDVVYIVVQKFA